MTRFSVELKPGGMKRWAERYTVAISNRKAAGEVWAILPWQDFAAGDEGGQAAAEAFATHELLRAVGCTMYDLAVTEWGPVIVSHSVGESEMTPAKMVAKTNKLLEAVDLVAPYVHGDTRLVATGMKPELDSCREAYGITADNHIGAPIQEGRKLQMPGEGQFGPANRAQ